MCDNTSPKYVCVVTELVWILDFKQILLLLLLLLLIISDLRSVMSESFLMKSLMLPSRGLVPPNAENMSSISPQSPSLRGTNSNISEVVDLRFSLPAHAPFPYPPGYTAANLTPLLPGNLPNFPSPCYRHAHKMFDVMCPMCTSQNSAAGLSMLHNLSARYMQQQHLQSQQRIQQSHHQISLQMAAKLNHSSLKVL